ncbi:MAG TPA: hypothetical protein PL137_01585 [Nocardioides sp.]|nr:hypothetical protein [Nocardioides sp.]
MLLLELVGLVEASALLGGRAERLTQPQRVEVVDVDVDVPDPVVGVVGEEGEGQVLEGIEAVDRVSGIDEPHLVRLQRLAHRGVRLGLVDLADVTGVRLAPSQRVEHVPPGHRVLVVRAQRLEHQHPRELRLGLQHVDLVGVGEPAGLEPVGAHRGEFGQVVDPVAMLHLDHERGRVADDLVEPGLLTALVDLGEVLLEEV